MKKILCAAMTAMCLALCAFAEEGVLSSYGVSKSPVDPVTHEELLTVAERLAESYDNESDYFSEIASVNVFPDSDNATRAEAVAVLHAAVPAGKRVVYNPDVKVSDVTRQDDYYSEIMDFTAPVSSSASRTAPLSRIAP